MLEVSKIKVSGWDAAIRGMRNPMESWGNSDSAFDTNGEMMCLGINDFELMMKLRNAGSDHRKFMRMLVVTMDINAPLFWWKEFDTYKVSTVRNSCSTMHKIHASPITHVDFGWVENESKIKDMVVEHCEYCRQQFVETKDTEWWRELIELLPSSYMQKATVMVNYETLCNMYYSRHNHKLQEWRYLTEVMKTLPAPRLITE